MGILEPITHAEEIEDILNRAQTSYDASLKKFESQKKATTKSLEHLGTVKLDAWSSEMDSFIDVFNTFNTLNVSKKLNLSTSFAGSEENPQQIIMNIQAASMTASEVAKAGAAALGTGALVGIASYGGAMMFGSASTGTAIATLKGAAKTNATLAWFGGGAIKAGGLGMAGGTLVLAGVVVAPILAVAALITNAKAKEKLAEAKRIHAEAMDAVSKMDTVTTGMKAIEKMSLNYSRFIKQFRKKFRPFIDELNRIKNAHATENNGQIEFDSLSITEQQTLHISWLMAQVYYHVLSAPILTSSGEVSPEATKTLSASSKEFKQIRKQTFKMNGEEAPVGDLMWSVPAKKMAVVNFSLMALTIALGIKTVSDSVFAGIALLLVSLIASPVFIKFKNLPQSKRYLWRMVRAAATILCVIIIFVIKA